MSSQGSAPLVRDAEPYTFLLSPVFFINFESCFQIVNMLRRYIVLLIYITTIFCTSAQEITDSLGSAKDLDEFVVTSNNGRRKLTSSGLNTEIITSAELKKAACCNLGESFTTNPSVDVSYSDAATGARQIKLLGLGGQYVQMLTENVPNFRGAAAPFGLSYLAGPWMSSIQVSKGTSSVKNGYESITGQINIEMLKPQTDQSLAINGYVNSMAKAELNASGNIHLSDRWSTGLLLHGENSFKGHDDNEDSFLDSPNIRQFAGLNRWIYMGDKYVFQATVKFLNERREGGQRGHHASTIENPYLIDIRTNRVETFQKHAFIFDKENDGNIATILSFSYHNQDYGYGNKFYDVDQMNFYWTGMFERKWNQIHALSTGLSFNTDRLKQRHDLFSPNNLIKDYQGDSSIGGYAQYTFNPSDNLVAMAGVRYDWSNKLKSMFTPRIHIRWNPWDALSVHGSAGKGYRYAFPLAENTWILPSSRQIIFDEDLHKEEAWNMGGGFSGKFNVGSVPFNWNAEYYYTNFIRQTVIDMNEDSHSVHIKSLRGKSRSHSLLAELNCDLLPDLNIALAAKMDDVRLDYVRGMEMKPLNSKWKGLVTVSYSPMMGIWQFDTSLSINGGGKMPKPYMTDDGSMSWNTTYKAFPQWNAQITRNFRHWSIYVGGENLTGYRQKMPIVDAHNPWGPNFDASMIYGPLEGRMIYIGFRYNFTKY